MTPRHTTPEPEPDLRSRLPEAIVAVAGRIAALLRSCEGVGRDGGAVTEAGAGARAGAGASASAPIPGAEWTVAESAAHLAMANGLMAALAAGHEQPYGNGRASGLADANAASLATYTERDPSVLADEIVRHARAFNDAAATRSPAEPTVTPLGPMDLGTLGSYLLTHMLGHGYDMAVALRRPHMIDAALVGLCMPFLTTAMPWVVDPRTAAGHNACYDLRVRGGARFHVTFTDGTATVGSGAPRRPDCVILAEPVTFFLLALGRRTPAGAVARGKVFTWGRKPWLGFRFPTLFTAP